MTEYDKTRLLELVIDYANASIWLEKNLERVSQNSKVLEFWEEEKKSCWNHINEIIEKE